MDYVEAIYDYAGAHGSTDMAFKKGQTFRVVSRENEQWLKVEIEGREGYVPANYVQPASVPKPGTPEAPKRSEALSKQSSLASLDITGEEGPLPDDWKEATDPRGLKYYYNKRTKETSWKRPTGASGASAESPAPVTTPAAAPQPQAPPTIPVPVATPAGMSQSPSAKRISMLPVVPPVIAPVVAPTPLIKTPMEEEWVEATDPNGNKYYYDRVSKQTSWTLPPGAVTSDEQLRRPSVAPPPVSSPSTQPRKASAATEQQLAPPQAAQPAQQSPTQSRKLSGVEDYVVDGSQVLKEGTLARKAVTDMGGKKAGDRSWSEGFAVLRGTVLEFYKDQKSVGQKLQQVIPLDGGSADIAYGYTKKKFVFSVTTVSGSQTYLLADSHEAMVDWIMNIQKALTVKREMIDKGTLTLKGKQDVKKMKEDEKQKKKDDDKKKKDDKPAPALKKAKQTEVVDINDNDSADVKNKKIKNRLVNFFQNRPSMEALKAEGLIQEQTFGCALYKLAEKERVTVPTFVQKAVAAIERKGLVMVGIYRLSASTTLVQKMRIAVNHEEPVDFEDPMWEDINTTAGTLKLYFRELPEPLIPYATYPRVIDVMKTCDVSERAATLKRILYEMPEPNLHTLKFMMVHLARIAENGAVNKMLPTNLAIVFGPTLMKAENETHEMIINMTYQNQFIEYLIVNKDIIFD